MTTIEQIESAITSIGMATGELEVVDSEKLPDHLSEDFEAIKGELQDLGDRLENFLEDYREFKRERKRKREEESSDT